MVQIDIKCNAEILWENEWEKSALCSSTWRNGASNQKIPLSNHSNLQFEIFLLHKLERGEFQKMYQEIIWFKQESMNFLIANLKTHEI